MQVTQRFAQLLTKNVGKVIVGKEDAVGLMMIALLCRGHVLIEDVPGVGKTTLASALARSLDCSFKRIQFTPDITPSDITGFSIANFKTGELEYRPGMIMSQIVLADEINRTSPKTQSSLLEVMEEGQVSVDGVTYAMPRPFIVLATQNPVDFVGTYPLPEAQLDRFLMKISMLYPTLEQEVAILQRHQENARLVKLDSLKPILTRDELLHYRVLATRVTVDASLLTYIAQVVQQTRADHAVYLGASPRAAVALLRASKAMALMQGRDYVTPDDIKYVAPAVLQHRMILTSEAEMEGQTAIKVVMRLINQVQIPN